MEVQAPRQGDPGRGRAAFEKFECFTCHEIKGEKFPSPTKPDAIGPDLSSMGQHHSVGFIAESNMNPSTLIDPGQGYAARDGSSKMPSFNDSMTVQELVDLVAYLKGLRRPRGRHGQAITIRRFGLLLCPLLLSVTAVTWADHGRGDLRLPANPWWEAILWGALGFLVALMVTLVVMLFTRSPAPRDPGGQSRS